MYTVDAEGKKHFRDLHQVFMDLMITSHTTSKNMEKDLLAISGGKFQWSKVASVLGSYKDFIHAYNLSISSANFSNKQIEAQLDTIDRRYQQLKATMTSVATGVGNSGLSKFIKDTLVNLNALVQAFQRIPSGVYEGIAAFAKWGTLLIGTVGTLRLLVKGIIDMQLAYKAVTVAQAAETVATNVSTASKAKNLAMRILGINSTRAQATASAAATAGLVAEGAAAQGAAVATGEMAASVTVATAGLNLLIAALAVAALGFFGYTSIVGDAVKKQDEMAQKQKDHISAMEQQADALERENEFIGVLCENHGKLQQALETTKEGTEQHKRAEEDLAATDKELADVIGEDAASNIDWSKGWQTVMQEEKEKHSQKIQSMRTEIANAKEAQMAYTQNQINWTKDRIKALENEGNSWVALKNVIESFVHMLGSALINIADFAESARNSLKDVPGLGKIVGFFGGDINTLGSGAISGARSQGASLQGWKAPDMLVNGFNYALSMTPGVQIPWLANKYFDWKRSNELEYQKGDLEKLEKQYEQDKADFYGAKIAAMKGDGDSGTVDEAPGKGGNTKSPKGGSNGAGAKEADNSIEAMLYRHMRSALKLTHAQAVGELANIQQESGFNYQADNGTHKGLYQFDSSRWAAYQGWLASTGRTNSAVSQVDFRHLYETNAKYSPYEASQNQRYLTSGATTPREWAAAFNEFIERSGEKAGSVGYENRMRNADALDKRFAKRNGEENFDDVLGAREDAYKRLYEQFNREIDNLKTERAKIGQDISAEEKLKIFRQIMGVGNGKSNAIFAEVEKAQKDYLKLLIEVAKEESKRAEAIKKSAETQTKAVEKMADGEIEFAEKIGLINKQDVRQYYRQKNEDNYHTKKPMMDFSLARTVDLSKGSANDMLEALQGLLDAQDNMEREMYAKRIFNLSRDVQATKKALDERLKLEQEYQEKRQQLAREEYEHNNRYTLKFIDSMTNAFQSGLESILNRTKSFAEAFRDIFKSIVNDIIKMFSEDLAARFKKWLSNVLQPTKKTGNKAGTGYSKGNAGYNLVGWGMDNLPLLSGNYGGKKKSKGGMGGFDLMGWATNSLSSLGGGKGKNGQANNPLLKAIIPSTAQVKKAMVAPMNAVKNAVTNNMQGVVQATSAGMSTIQEVSTTGYQEISALHIAAKGAETTAVVTGNAVEVASTQEAQAQTATSMNATMGYIMAALALLSIFMSLGGGSKSETSTSSVNLGRSPDSYYMTPTPVMQSTTFNVPSFDIGGNIEQDMFAMVHKGEMVLTPEQADVIRNTARSGGSMGNGGNASASVKSNINVSTVDSRGFDRVLRDYSRDLSKNIKKSIRNGYLNAKGLV